METLPGLKALRQDPGEKENFEKASHWADCVGENRREEIKSSKGFWLWFLILGTSTTERWGFIERIVSKKKEIKSSKDLASELLVCLKSSSQSS